MPLPRATGTFQPWLPCFPRGRARPTSPFRLSTEPLPHSIPNRHGWCRRHGPQSLPGRSRGSASPAVAGARCAGLDQPLEGRRPRFLGVEVVHEQVPATRGRSRPRGSPAARLRPANGLGQSAKRSRSRARSRSRPSLEWGRVGNGQGREDRRLAGGSARPVRLAPGACAACLTCRGCRCRSRSSLPDVSVQSPGQDMTMERNERVAQPRPRCIP